MSWTNVRVHLKPKNSGAILRWPNGTYQRVSVGHEAPSSSLVRVAFAPICHHPYDSFCNIGLLFRCGLDQSEVSLAECYRQDASATMKMLNNFFEVIERRIKKDNGTQEGEMEDLVRFYELARSHRDTRRMVPFLRGQIERLGTYRVRGPRGGTLKRRWLTTMREKQIFG